MSFQTQYEEFLLIMIRRYPSKRPSKTFSWSRFEGFGFPSTEYVLKGDQSAKMSPLRGFDYVSPNRFYKDFTATRLVET